MGLAGIFVINMIICDLLRLPLKCVKTGALA